MVDDEDFVWLSQWKWQFHCGYARRRQGKTTIHMHRLLMNCSEGLEVDHINRNKLDNQKSNLRIVTRQQNMCNKDSYKNSSSRYKGVTWHKKDNRWDAQIRLNKQIYFIGSFEDEDVAAAAYNHYAKRFFGEYAVLNNVPEADFRKARFIKNNCTSVYRGIFYSKIHKRWVARIGVNKKRIYLGYFEREVDAARAYNEAFEKYKPNKVVTNRI
ncbi:MAG: HNH endonuclease [Clostridiaceae bacterium]